MKALKMTLILVLAGMQIVNSQVRFIDPNEAVIMSPLPYYDVTNQRYKIYFVYNFSDIDQSITFDDGKLGVLNWTGIRSDGSRSAINNVAPNDSEYLLNQSDYEEFERIELQCNYSLNGLSYVTRTYTLPLSRNTTVNSVEFNYLRGVYFPNTNKNQLRVDVRASEDGVLIDNLILSTSRDSPVQNSQKIAEISNVYLYRTESPINLITVPTPAIYRPNDKVYLHAQFSKNGSPFHDWNGREIVVREQTVCQVIEISPTTFFGDGNFTLMARTNGIFQNLKLDFINSVRPTIEGQLLADGNNEWNFTIPSDVPYGPHEIKFSGNSTCQVSERTTKSFNKNQVSWSRLYLSMSDDNSKYEVKVKLNQPSTNVNLIIGDSSDPSMFQRIGLIPIDESKKDFKSNINLSVTDFQNLTQHIYNQDAKTIPLQVEIDGNIISQTIDAPAFVVNLNGLNSSSSRRDIRERLKEAGIEENINEITQSIREELAQDDDSRNWDNVWSTVIALAPKLFTLFLI